MLRTAVLLGARRIPLTSKHGNRFYYKGRGARSTGFHTRKGGYVMDPYKEVRYVVPNLTDCELKPFVSLHMKEEVEGPRLTADQLLHSELVKPALTPENGAAFDTEAKEAVRNENKGKLKLW